MVDRAIDASAPQLANLPSRTESPCEIAMLTGAMIHSRLQRVVSLAMATLAQSDCVFVHVPKPIVVKL